MTQTNPVLGLDCVCAVPNLLDYVPLVADFGRFDDVPFIWLKRSASLLLVASIMRLLILRKSMRRTFV